MRTFLLLLLLLLTPLVSQARQSVGVMVNDVGLSIGDSKEVTGLRLNFRDRNMRMVRGVNATIWTAHEPMRGTVNGVALGLPATSAEYITGYGWGLFGVGAEKDLTGVAFGGLGVGAGENVSGLILAGLGVGAGGDFNGVGIAGIGAGAGGDIKGITLSGLASGSGGTMTGLHVAGFAIGAESVNGLIVAPGYFRIEEGFQNGLAASAVSVVRGDQRGVTIGLYNYARKLEGVQIGLINHAANKKRFKVLPLINF